MGIICNIFGHKDEAINFWGEQAQYVLFKCNRCQKEHISCSYEMKELLNDEKGKRVLHKMMTDPVFSAACRIHSEFVEVEKNNMLSTSGRENGYKELREKYGLPDNYRPACPVILFESGFWIEENKDEEKPKPRLKKIDIDQINNMINKDNESNTLEGESESFIIYKNIINMENEDKTEYTNEVQVVEYEFQKKPSKENTIAELEKLEKIYAEKENYEKAAEIFKRIQELKGNK